MSLFRVVKKLIVFLICIAIGGLIVFFVPSALGVTISAVAVGILLGLSEGWFCRRFRLDEGLHRLTTCRKHCGELGWDALRVETLATERVVCMGTDCISRKIDGRYRCRACKRVVRSGMTVIVPAFLNGGSE